MGATLELKYFNSYWVKKLSKIVDNDPVDPNDAGQPDGYANVPYLNTNDNNNNWFIEEARIKGD